MKALYDEIIQRFPEVRQHLSEGDEEFPYVAMGAVAAWLKSLGRTNITTEIVQRIVEFGKWCEAHPGGETAADDVYTMYVVAFLEHLFEAETIWLIPRLIQKDDFLRNADYLKTWVGAENYQLALTMFP